MCFILSAVDQYVLYLFSPMATSVNTLFLFESE